LELSNIQIKGNLALGCLVALFRKPSEIQGLPWVSKENVRRIAAQNFLVSFVFFQFFENFGSNSAEIGRESAEIGREQPRLGDGIFPIDINSFCLGTWRNQLVSASGVLDQNPNSRDWEMGYFLYRYPSILSGDMEKSASFSIWGA
jgi:hypothetical protein